MHTDIFLVRHGEAAAGWGDSSDPGLSDLGLQQARDVAQTLQSLVGDDTRLLSSPLARARATAAPLAAALDLSVQLNDAFREIPAPVPLAERRAWLREFMTQHWDDQPQSLQSWRDQATQQLLRLGGPAVVFSHFVVINAVVGQILGEQKTLHFYPDNGSITHLRRVDDALELVSLGSQMKTVVN